jgi:hypothetical protein
MEPIDLNSPDHALEAILRKNAAAPLPDDGFSARVLAALPPRKKSSTGAYWGYGAGILATLWVVLGPGRLLEHLGGETDSLSSALMPLLATLMDPALVAVLALSAGAWMIFSDEDTPEPEMPPLL